MNASNGKTGHPGRLLPAEEEDGGRGRLRDPHQPQAHRHHAVTIPEGLAGRRHRRRSWRPRRSSPRPSSTRRCRTPRRSGCRRTPRATRRATSSRRRTASARRRSRPTCSRTWSTGGSRPPTRTASWPARQAQGKTPAEIMTIASLVQAEGRGYDMPKVARVIYNRLDGPGDQGGTNGRLQIDATVNYALNRTGVGGRRRRTRSTTPTRRTTPTRTRACRRARSTRPVTRPSRRRCIRPTGPGTTTSRSTWRRARPSSATTYQEFLQFKQEFRTVLRRRRTRAEDGTCAAPFSVTRSSTRCRRSCTGRRTPRWGWTGPTTRCGCRAAGSRTSSAGWTRAGAGCR